MSWTFYSRDTNEFSITVRHTAALWARPANVGFFLHTLTPGQASQEFHSHRFSPHFSRSLSHTYPSMSRGSAGPAQSSCFSNRTAIKWKFVVVWRQAGLLQTINQTCLFTFQSSFIIITTIIGELWVKCSRTKEGRWRSGWREPSYATHLLLRLFRFRTKDTRTTPQ